MSVSFVYVTASSTDEALSIGRALVELRLAACVNVFSNMASIYRWQGAIEQSTEAVLLVKTRDELVPAVMERVRSLHGYECPCIVSWPIERGNPQYLDWILRETHCDPQALHGRSDAIDDEGVVA